MVSITPRPASLRVMNSSAAIAAAPALAPPTQPNMLTRSDRRKGSLRLSRATPDISSAVMAL